MEAEDSRQELRDLIDAESLKEILSAFTTTTGLMANVVDIYGRSIFSKSDIKKCCKFCKLIFAMEDGQERCRGAYERAGKQAALFNEPYIFRCPSGLVEWAAPIMLDGRHLGSIICGQVLMWEPEEFFWIELREMNKGLVSDFKELFKAVEELPVVSGDMVQAASYLLLTIANFITRSGFETRRRGEELKRQKRRLDEELETRKKLEEQLGQMFFYSMDQEQELMELLREGKTEQADRLLEKITNDIVLGSKGNMDLIRTRAIELVVVIARTAVRANVPQERASQIDSALIKMIQMENSIDDVGRCLQMAISIYQKEIQDAVEIPEAAGIKIMKGYMQAHFREDLTLEVIAGAASLSVSYASRLFKKTLNMSVMDYLRKLRINEAKKMLRESEIQIDEIAVRAGYSDAGYFAKVFRKTEHMTPSQYRRTYKNIPAL